MRGVELSENVCPSPCHLPPHLPATAPLPRCVTLLLCPRLSLAQHPSPPFFSSFSHFRENRQLLFACLPSSINPLLSLFPSPSLRKTDSTALAHPPARLTLRSHDPQLIADKERTKLESSRAGANTAQTWTWIPGWGRATVS